MTFILIDYFSSLPYGILLVQKEKKNKKIEKNKINKYENFSHSSLSRVD